MGSWSCEIAGEDAPQVTFEGPKGRLHVDVHRGRIGREVYRGLLSMSQPKQRLTLHDPFKVEYRRSEPRHLRIHPLNGRGGDVVLRMVDAPAWPLFLIAEIQEIFELKVEPGTKEAAFRATGAESGRKGAGVPKPIPKGRVVSEATKAKLRETLRATLLAKGIVMKDKTPTSPKRRKKRGRKTKVANGRKRTEQGHEQLPQADAGHPEGDGPSHGLDAGQQKAVDLTSSIITA